MKASPADAPAEAIPRERLVAFLERRTGSRALAEDVAHDAIARMLDFARREDVRHPQALLFRIAANLLINRHRREARYSALLADNDVVDDRPSAERALLDADRLHHLRQTIAKLPPLRREVLIRRRLDGQSYREIGEALGMSVAAVEKHMVRALATLRAEQERQMVEGSAPW